LQRAGLRAKLRPRVVSRGMSSDPEAGYRAPTVADHAAEAARLATAVAIPPRASRTD
jgi:hypothetical protein